MKKLVIAYLCEGEDYELSRLNGKVVEVIDYLNQLKERFGDSLEIDYSYNQITLTYYRIESDEEYRDRIKWEREKAEREVERMEYEAKIEAKKRAEQNDKIRKEIEELIRKLL